MKNKTILTFLILAMATLDTYADESTPISATKVEQGKVTTGIGNTDVPILRSTLTISNPTRSVELQGVTGMVKATNLKDVKAIRAYFASNPQELFVDSKKEMTWRESNAIPYAEGKIEKDGTFIITGIRSLTSGTYYLWIALDISKKAQEGNMVDADRKSVV